MDVIVAIFAGVSLIIIIIVSIVMYVQNEKTRRDVELTLRDIVDQINYTNRYSYKFDKLQEDNIKSMDTNIQSLRMRLDMLYPNNAQICLGTTCMDKSDMSNIISTVAKMSTTTSPTTSKTP